MMQYFNDLYLAGKLSQSWIINSSDTTKTLDALKVFIIDKMLNSKVELDNHPDFYLVKRQEGARDISIEQIRYLQQFLYKKSAFDGKKVAIIYEADLMNLNAANSMLKILEDTPNYSYIFLITNKSSKLLATVKSRCASLRHPELVSGSKNQLNEILKQVQDDGCAYNFTYEEFVDLVTSNDLNKELDIIKKLKNKDRELWSEIGAHAVSFLGDFIKKSDNPNNLIHEFDDISSMISEVIEYDLDLSASFIILLNEFKKITRHAKAS
jgi:DNA polymerase III subunit delta'